MVQFCIVGKDVTDIVSNTLEFEIEDIDNEIAAKKVNNVQNITYAFQL